eukprot:10321752-Heterocapsa_arctica.AAC.1
MSASAMPTFSAGNSAMLASILHRQALGPRRALRPPPRRLAGRKSEDLRRAQLLVPPRRARPSPQAPPDIAEIKGPSGPKKGRGL